MANRVGEIQRKSEPSQWQYVATELNPADKLTRGEAVSELVKDKVWWTGPEFLQLEPEEWPVTDFSCGTDNTEKRRKFVDLFIYLFIYCHLYSAFSIVQCSNALYRL